MGSPTLGWFLRPVGKNGNGRQDSQQIQKNAAVCGKNQADGEAGKKARNEHGHTEHDRQQIHRQLRSRQSLCERLVAWLGISSLEAMLKGNATKMQTVCPNIGAFIETFKEEGQT